MRVVYEYIFFVLNKVPFMPSERFIDTSVLRAIETVAPVTYVSENKEIAFDETTPCIEIHIQPFLEDERREYVNKSRITESLVDMAHYVELRAPFYKPEYVIGVTHMKVGRIAAKLFDFDLITNLPASSYPEDVVAQLEEYGQPPCIVTMKVDTLLEKYGTGGASDVVCRIVRMSNLVDQLYIDVIEAAAKLEKEIK